MLQKEVIVLQPLNGKDFNLLDTATREVVGFMLKKADKNAGFELFPHFEVPEDFPQSASSIMVGWAIFTKYYLNNIQKKKK
jgi:hypothetical protein